MVILVPGRENQQHNLDQSWMCPHLVLDRLLTPTRTTLFFVVEVGVWIITLETWYWETLYSCYEEWIYSPFHQEIEKKAHIHRCQYWQQYSYDGSPLFVSWKKERHCWDACGLIWVMYRAMKKTGQALRGDAQDISDLLLLLQSLIRWI